MRPRTNPTTQARGDGSDGKKDYLKRFSQAVVLVALNGCQMVYTHEGTIAAGTRGAHSFDRELARGAPIANAVVWVEDDPWHNECPDLRDPRWRTGVSDESGHYSVEVGGRPPEWRGQRRVLVCFAADGFEPYGFVHPSQTRCGGSEDDRKCYLNVKLRPVTGRSKPR